MEKTISKEKLETKFSNGKFIYVFPKIDGYVQSTDRYQLEYNEMKYYTIIIKEEGFTTEEHPLGQGYYKECWGTFFEKEGKVYFHIPNNYSYQKTHSYYLVTEKKEYSFTLLAI